jgi:putative transposase
MSGGWRCWIFCGTDTQRILYATDLTDAEWALLAPLLPPESPIGRPRLHSLRAILNAIFYQLRTGGAWRFLPQEWPPWQTVYHYVQNLAAERIHRLLRDDYHMCLGRNPQPNALYAAIKDYIAF